MKTLKNALTLMFALAFSISGSSCKKKQSQVTEIEESDSEKVEAIQSAFTSEIDFTDTGKEKKIAEKILKRLSIAIINKDENEVNEIYSAKILGNYCISKFKEKFSSKQKKSILNEFEKVLGKTMIQQSSFYRFDDTEIRKIEKISAKEFICYTKEWDGEMQTYTNTRWWFINTGDDSANKWQIYDNEDIGAGMRYSNIFIASFSAMLKKVEWTKSFIELAQVMQTAQNPADVDFALLTPISKKITESDAPEEIKNIAATMYISGLLAGEKYELCIKTAKKQLAKTSDLYILNYTLAMAYKELAKYDEAIEALEVYIDFMGVDSETYMELADIYYLKEDFQKSKELSLTGINMNPLHSHCLASYAILTDESEWPDLIQRIEATKKEATAYELIMDYAIQVEKTELAQWLFTHFKEKYPDETDLIEYYEGEFKPKAETEMDTEMNAVR